MGLGEIRLGEMGLGEMGLGEMGQNLEYATGTSQKLE